MPHLQISQDENRTSQNGENNSSRFQGNNNVTNNYMARDPIELRDIIIDLQQELNEAYRLAVDREIKMNYTLELVINAKNEVIITKNQIIETKDEVILRDAEIKKVLYRYQEDFKSRF